MSCPSARLSWACLMSLSASAAFAAPPEFVPAPITLTQAVAAALERNPELASFGFQVRAREARERQVALRPATEVQLEAENFLGSREARGVDAAEATLALSQVIELGDKRGARLSAALAETELARIEQQAAQLDVLADVTRRFIAVVEGQELLSLSRSATAIAKATVAASERRVNAAKAPSAELDRSRIALARAELDEQQAIYRLEAARRSLAASWGEPDGTLGGAPIGLAEADLYAVPEPGSFTALMDRLVANPDFLRFASEVRLREAAVRLAASQRSTDVTLGAGVRRLQSTDETAFVASLSLPLFAGRRAEPFVAEAEASRGFSEAQRQAALVNARVGLFELHQELRYAVLEAQTLKDATKPQMAKALQETQQAFDRGRYSYLELVDAQRAYLEVQRSLIEAAARAHALRAEIERLTAAPMTAAAR